MAIHKISNKTKAVIDTNVIISALLFGGLPGKLIPMWENGSIKPIVSKDIMDEYIRVLAYPKFELTQEEIQYLIYQRILPYFEIVKATLGKTFVPNDPSDDKFIQCALTGFAEAIISGDTHLLSLKKYKDIPIITPSQFFEIMYKS